MLRDYPFTILFILIVLVVFVLGLLYATSITLITFGVIAGLGLFQWLLFKVSDEF
ncbi:hypothetical protein PBI_GRAYSON_211 [Rhodococcus phage Grayson]|nr:hypothetical protein PBI_GRAYSON_211 [Rhodococcus phage Grayson]